LNIPLLPRPPWPGLAACAVALSQTLTATLLGAAPTAALAADSADQIRRQALLRGYNTAEAERRYEQTQRLNQPSISGGALAGATGALAAMVARNEARARAANQLQQQMYEAVAKGLDFKMDTVSDAEAMRTMLDLNAAGDDYRWPARKRLVEMALHQRRQAEHLFNKPDYALAATELRKNAYGGDDFHPWSAWMLAKLYLMGAGVPQDEGEAADLLQACITKQGKGYTDTRVATVGCHVLQAEMHANGWGYARDADKAAKAMGEAREWHQRYFQQAATDQQLRERFR
jgi:hypothetical protein